MILSLLTLLRLNRDYCNDCQEFVSSNEGNSIDLINKWTEQAGQSCAQYAPPQFQTMCKVVTQTALKNYLTRIYEGDDDFCHNVELCPANADPVEPTETCDACLTFIDDVQFMAKSDWATYTSVYKNVVTGMCSTLDGVLVFLCKNGLGQFENFSANELLSVTKREICTKALFCESDNL